MSEYQRYEFMTIDRPLTKQELDEVNDLSSHIEASATRALIEYHWGDFKHDPIDVLYRYFDGFLYWANWGAPRLAFRFPHESLPANLIDGYGFDDLVTFIRHKDYDILDISFPEMGSPDYWTEYELGMLIPLREELMEGDLRALYIAWLASQRVASRYYRRYEDEDEEEENSEYEEDEEEDEDGEDEDEGENEGDDDEKAVPVPPGLSTLTDAQRELATLLQVPEEVIGAAARHSDQAAAKAQDDFVAWVRLLPEKRRENYLVALAQNEPGLSRRLVKELRELGGTSSQATSAKAERVPYRMLLAESKAVKVALERERREQEQLALQRHLQEVHDHQEEYWQRVEMGAAKGSGSGYDDALKLLVELRAAADNFNESPTFQERFRTWIQRHMRRPALLTRLQNNKFTLP